MEIEKACRYAVIGSGISVSRRYVMGAIPYREEIEKIYSELYEN
jgi:sugar/nucleoside kinase (ribokinase family)